MVTSRGLPKPHLTHIAFRVKDMDASVAFYRKYCDLSVVHTRAQKDSGSRVSWLAETDANPPAFVLVLYQDGNPPVRTSDFNHLGYALPSRDAVDRYAALAREDGILTLGPKYMDDIVGYIANVTDPDGNIVEYSYGQVLGRAETGD